MQNIMFKAPLWEKSLRGVFLLLFYGIIWLIFKREKTNS